MHGSHEPTDAPARRQTTQTIAQIEARAAEVAQHEREAVCRIADLLRELAVTLPAESKLPMRFAKTARSIDGRGACEVGNSLAAYDVNSLAGECGREQERDAAAAMVRAVEMFPSGSLNGRALSELRDFLRERFELS